MQQRLTTHVRPELKLVRKLILGTTIVGCLIVTFILLSNLLTTETMASAASAKKKYTVSGNALSPENKMVWDILTNGDTVEITNQLKLKSDLDLTKTDIVIYLNGGELMWTAGHRLILGENSKILRSGDGVLAGNTDNLDRKMRIYFGRQPVISWDGNNGNLLSFSDINANRGYDHGLITVEPELIHFKATSTANGIVFRWATSAERFTRCFEIQRSLDGKSFKTIRTIPGNGTTAQRSDYSCTAGQDHGFTHTAYYRLKQVAFNGGIELSPVVTHNATDPHLALGNTDPGWEEHRLF